MARVKIGSGHLAAMARLGMAEIRQAASMTSGSVEQPTPYGMVGNVTPGEVSQARNANGLGGNQEGVAPARQTIASMRAAAAAQQQSNNGQQMQQQRLRGGRAM